MRFRDRKQAGELLARKLEQYRRSQVVVYALPRGGVVVGAEVARHLGAPLDLVIPRKVGFPGHPEYAVCAVTERGQLVCDEAVSARLNPEWLRREAEREMTEARRRRERYLAGREPVLAEGKTAIIVDDGIATGLTVQAAILEVRERRPAKIVVAVPVLPAEVARQLERDDVEVVALEVPSVYAGAVGAYFERFDQVEDEKVMAIMEALRRAGSGART